MIRRMSADSASVPSELQVSRAVLARRLGRLKTELAKLSEEESHMVEEPSVRPGLTRLFQAADRLAAAVQIKDMAGELALFEHFDAQTLDVLISAADSILRAPVWNVESSYDMARRIELEIELTGRRVLLSPSYEWRTPDLENLVVAAESSRRAIELELHIVKQRREVDSIVGDVQQAAGITADTQLATAFSHYGEDETRSANRFRLAAIGVLIAVSGFSIYTAINIPVSLGSSLAHLGIAASGLAAFGYLARESNQHRNVGRWAGIISVQLRTLGAFSADMNHEQREHLRAHFGRRVFAELSPTGDMKDPGTDLVPTIQAAQDLIKLLRGLPG
jgi:hypothetical protein